MSTFEVSKLEVGDILLWPKRHVAIYAGNGKLFHSHGGDGYGSVGYTGDLISWWLKERGIPQIYR